MKVHYKTLDKIWKYAKGSFFRMNATTAKYYHFSIFKDDKGSIDWQGGYSWGEKYNDEYLLDLSTGKLI